MASTKDLIEQISQLKNIKIEGLMTIGPLTNDKEKICNSFKQLKGIFQQLSVLQYPNCVMKYLSMGMSMDFELAIEQGSNMVRIGTAILRKPAERGKRQARIAGRR